jgi:hypothetical protein
MLAKSSYQVPLAFNPSNHLLYDRQSHSRPEFGHESQECTAHFLHLPIAQVLTDVSPVASGFAKPLPTRYGECDMVDTVRARFPGDMTRAAEFPAMGDLEHVANDLLDRLKSYARDEPVSFGLWAFGIGFVIGWKLKPW